MKLVYSHLIRQYTAKALITMSMWM